MGKRPGRGVGDVVPELEVPAQRQHAFSSGTLEYIVTFSKNQRQHLNDYDPHAYETIAESWLSANGDYFFGPGCGTRYQWPKQADMLVPPIRDMMMRQWSYQKARTTDKDWASDDSDEEYSESNERKRPRTMDEADWETIDVSRPKIPRFTHTNDTHAASAPIPPPPTDRSVPVSPSLNHQAFVPNRAAAQKATVSISRMAQQPFNTSQEEPKKEGTPLALREPRSMIPSTTSLKFANGSRTVEMITMAAGALVQSMIEQIEDVITYHMQSMEAGVSEVEIDFHMQSSEKLIKMLFDLERRARKAALAREIKQG